MFCCGFQFGFRRVELHLDHRGLCPIRYNLRLFQVKTRLMGSSKIEVEVRIDLRSHGARR